MSYLLQIYVLFLSEIIISKLGSKITRLCLFWIDSVVVIEINLGYHALSQTKQRSLVQSVTFQQVKWINHLILLILHMIAPVRTFELLQIL